MQRLNTRGVRLQRKALALAIGSIGLGFTGLAFAQATTGTIFGQAPVASGETVQITGGSGYNRTVPLNQSGRYSVTLPVGTYTVSLVQNGQIVQSRNNVTPHAAGSIEVDFSTAPNAANAQTLSAVTVSANAVPAIDVTTTTTMTTITAQELQHLPLQRSAEAIAMLAPGVTQGAAMLGGGPLGNALLSFGGASVAENAYYIDGMNTSDPLGNQGGITLPYGSISQQQTLTAGYGAKYGRSIGGVINQIGKSGTNAWHFGGQILWRPTFAKGTPGNWHFNNPRVTDESLYPGQTKGDIYAYRNGDNSWETVYDAYVSGPLIKDKLFFFVSAEADKSKGNNIQAIGTNTNDFFSQEKPKYYAKIDWNINDNNILSVTGVKNSFNQSGTTYDYDYDTHQTGAFHSTDQIQDSSFKMWVANYTSYLTDNLTLQAMYGKMDGTYYTNQPAYPGLDPTVAHVTGAASQNPAMTGGVAGGITSSNPNRSLADPRHTSEVTNMRLDLDWRLGDHDIQFGIDNNLARDLNDGSAPTGPGYEWAYAQASKPTNPITGTDPGVPPYVAPTAGFPNGAQGYFVTKTIFANAASVKVKQRAQYIQDRWQITPRFLLSIGLRNDTFTNYNPSGIPYIRLTSPQWAPRLGFSWDVHGDSSLKIFGNAGRYYLALPAAVALRMAGAPTYLSTYYTYSGIDASGIPTGLTPITSNPATIPINNENGLPLDPKAVASRNAKAEYQDNFVLGMAQQINPSWVYGVTAEVSKMGRVLDDWDDTAKIYDQLIAQGVDPSTFDRSAISGAYLINPGQTSVIWVPDHSGGYVKTTITGAEQGLPAAKRNYYSLELYLQHPWDGKWFGKIDYVFSRSYGNTEGPIQSSIGQGGSSVSATEQWDYAELMSYANGDQANDQKHVLKAYGTYQIAPEWTVSGNLSIASGYPRVCLGYYGPQENSPGLGYGGGPYHWCGGHPAPPGSTGRTPWMHILSLSAEYRPDWAGKKLGFHVQVYNVFNEQKATQYFPSYGTSVNPNTLYKVIQGMETPRYVQFGITYDF